MIHVCVCRIGVQDRVNGSLGLWELRYRGIYMYELE